MEYIAAALRRGSVRAWIVLTVGYWIYLWSTPVPPGPLVRIVWSMMPSDKPNPNALNELPPLNIDKLMGEAPWTDYHLIEKVGVIACFPVAALIIGIAVSWTINGFRKGRKS